MTYVLKINGKSHKVDVDGDLPFSGQAKSVASDPDGFNEGWIEFSDYGRSAVKGTTTLDSVIANSSRRAGPRQPPNTITIHCR
jgi:hypothetical protein